MTNYMKSSKCSGLACRMCQKVLRSALGLVLHIEQCGDQGRVECEFCNRSYAKNSLPSHTRICRARCALDTETNIKDTHRENRDQPEEIVGNSGRLKRHSTIKAENKLKVLGKELENLPDSDKPDITDPKQHIKYVTHEKLNFTEKWSKEIKNLGQGSCPQARCKFTSTDIKQLTKHLEKCQHMKSGYICNFCRKAFQTEQEAIDHISTKHQKGRTRRKSDDSDCDIKVDSESSSDDGDLSEGVDENESTINSDNEIDDSEEESSNKKSKNKSKSCKLRYSRIVVPESRKEGNFHIYICT